MLQTIRDRATGWIAYTIVGLLIIPFALWGVNSYLGDPAPLDAAEVGDSKISLREFQQAFQRQRSRMQTMFGDNFDPAMLDEARLKQQVLQQLVNESILVQAANKQGFRVGDERLLRELHSIGAFQQEGVFEPEIYRRVLRSQGYTREGFEENLRTSLATEQFREGVMKSSLLTQTELDKFIGLLKQKRELTYLVLPLEQYREAATVDEAAIEDHFEKNKDRYRSPEQVKVQYLELDLGQIAQDIPVSDEELQMAYQDQLVKYTKPEERSASHILIKATEDDPEQARARVQTIYDEINSGSKTFQQALEEAQAPGVEGIEAAELGVVSEGLFDDPAFELALFALSEVGDISEPVQTSFGFHIIRLDDVNPEQVKSLDEVQDEVLQELRLQQAESRFYDAVETLSNLSYEHPDSLEPAAEALGLEVKESDWFDSRGGEAIAAYSKVVSMAFSAEVLDQGLNSEPIEVEPSHVVVIRVESREEAAPRNLEEVRDQIISQLKSQQARKALQEAAKAFAERAEQGESLQSLALESGGELKEIGLVSRTEPEIDSQILRAAFRLPRPEEDEVAVGSAVLSNGDQVVVTVGQVIDGTQADLEEAERSTIAASLTGELGTSEFQALLESLRKQTKVVTYNDRL